MNDIGVLAWHVMCEFQRDKVIQTACVYSLVELFGTQYESQTPPVCAEFDLGPKSNDENEGHWPYKQVVDGKLRISGMTPPDIDSAVRGLARHPHDPAVWHWNGVHTIIVYLTRCVPAGRGVEVVVICRPLC